MTGEGERMGVNIGDDWEIPQIRTRFREINEQSPQNENQKPGLLGAGRIRFFIHFCRDDSQNINGELISLRIPRRV